MQHVNRQVEDITELLYYVAFVCIVSKFEVLS